MKSRAWLVPLLFVFGVSLFFTAARVSRLLQLSETPTWSVDAVKVSETSTTGYAHGWRKAIVIDPTSQSQQWIAQTQNVLHDGDLFQQHVTYDNAPYGRRSSFSLLYRTWLVALSYAVSLCGIAKGVSVEMAALFSDPLLLLVAATLTGGYVAKRFGTTSGVLVTLQLFTVFPFATHFLPGVPHSQGAAEIFGLWELLLLWSGICGTASDGKRRLFLAGACGGVALSMNLTSELSLVLGIGLGAFIEILAFERNPGETLPWRAWGLGGCLASLVIFPLDRFSTLGEWHLEGLHPFYSVLWWLLGEVLQALSEWKTGGGMSLNRRLAAIACGVLLLGAFVLPLAKMSVLLSADIDANRLTRLPGGFTVGSTRDWWTQDAFSLRFWATMIPAGLTLVLAASAFIRRERGPSRRGLVIFGATLALVLLLAGGHLRWWSTFNGVAMALTVVLTTGNRARDLPFAIAGVAVSVLLGVVTLVPPRQAFTRGDFDLTEMRALMERDLAQWISQRQPKAVVLAPPGLTASLWYYGGNHGITTFDPENRDGFMAALRIAASTTAQEAQVLLRQRGVTHLVLPSWDAGLVEAARDVSDNKKSQFLEQLGDWILPGWTRPVSYFMPPIDGFENQKVVTLEVVDDSTDVALLSSMASFFVEEGMIGHAAQLRTFLKRFPNQLEALVSLAEIEHARGDDEAFRDTVHSIELSMETGAANSLSWERRLALVVTLVKAGKTEKALPLARSLYSLVEEQDLRSLSARSLYRVLALKKALRLQFTDTALEKLAPSLLPPELRHDLE